MSRRNKKREYLRSIWEGRSCVLCGGRRPAESAEHAPPYIIFRDKDRPDGLEVPACARCNNGSGVLDQFVAFAALSASPEAIFRERGMTEYDHKVVKGTANNADKVTQDGTHILYESATMVPVFDDDGNFSHAAYAVEFKSKVSESIAKWAAKQTLALWYFHTRKVASHRCVINVDVLTNSSKPSDEFMAMIGSMGPDYSLSDSYGGRNDEFSYKIVVNPEHGIGILFCQFHGGLAFISLLNDKGSAKISRRGLDYRFSTNAQRGIYRL